MSKKSLNAISPIDGRYSSKTENLSNFFSEKALIRYRVLVEIEYFISLTEVEIPGLSNWKSSDNKLIKNIYEKFSDDDAIEIKKIEKTTNHDVKAVEYFIKEKFNNLGFEDYSEYIHFGLTSQDVNNTAIPLSIKDFLPSYFLIIEDLINELSIKVKEYNGIAMLARTHGQPASPTRLGKEINVFKSRIIEQFNVIKTIPISCKFGGATGNMNAHKVAFPKIDWVNFSNNFAKKLNLKLSYPTTQIEHYDNLARLFDNFKRINTIILDLNKDLWQYISMDYFQQKIIKNEVGSSAMPHKVNPIDFENSEGNISYANAIFEFLSSKLPVSRLQRDLTDSTVLRNVGVYLAHSLLSYKNILSGLDKLTINEIVIKEDLESHPECLSEAIQILMRVYNIDNGYNIIRLATQNKRFTSLNDFKNEIIKYLNDNQINYPDILKEKIKNLSLYNY